MSCSRNWAVAEDGLYKIARSIVLLENIFTFLDYDGGELLNIENPFRLTLNDIPEPYHIFTLIILLGNTMKPGSFHSSCLQVRDEMQNEISHRSKTQYLLFVPMDVFWIWWGKNFLREWTQDTDTSRTRLSQFWDIRVNPSNKEGCTYTPCGHSFAILRPDDGIPREQKNLIRM